MVAINTLGDLNKLAGEFPSFFRGFRHIYRVRHTRELDTCINELDMKKTMIKNLMSWTQMRLQKLSE